MIVREQECAVRVTRYIQCVREGRKEPLFLVHQRGRAELPSDGETVGHDQSLSILLVGAGVVVAGRPPRNPPISGERQGHAAVVDDPSIVDVLYDPLIPRPQNLCSGRYARAFRIISVTYLELRASAPLPESA